MVRWNCLKRAGHLLNILRDAEFISSTVNLAAGDQIIFYTDGVTEIFNLEAKEFGFDKLKKIILRLKDASATKTINEIISTTKNFSGSKLYRDDFTLVVLKRKYY